MRSARATLFFLGQYNVGRAAWVRRHWITALGIAIAVLFPITFVGCLLEIPLIGGGWGRLRWLLPAFGTLVGLFQFFLLLRTAPMIAMIFNRERRTFSNDFFSPSWTAS